jgi:hypothetical protein
MIYDQIGKCMKKAHVDFLRNFVMTDFCEKACSIGPLYQMSWEIFPGKHGDHFITYIYSVFSATSLSIKNWLDSQWTKIKV